MPISRYAKDNIILRGSTLATPAATSEIRSAIAQGRLKTQVITLQGLGRLDELAGQFYGDGRYWWVIAAASNIGWGQQVPAGTRIVIPDISEIVSLLS